MARHLTPQRMAIRRCRSGVGLAARPASKWTASIFQTRPSERRPRTYRKSAIDEFQVASSSLDMSTELTSSGTVNVVTKSGKNEWHGGAYYYGRSNQTSAKIANNPDGSPADLPFGRKQFGGDIGGAFIQNKLFFFLDFERTDQSLQNPVTLGAGNPFNAFSGSYDSPFTEREYLARLDYNIKNNWTAFFRFNYDQNSSVRGFNPGVYQPFANVDYVPTYVAGTDFQIGKTTNSIRFEFLKFRNSIVDGVALSGAPDPAPGISLNITPNGSDLTCLGRRRTVLLRHQHPGAATDVPGRPAD